jgi:hypothetical protein
MRMQKELWFNSSVKKGVFLMTKRYAIAAALLLSSLLGCSSLQSSNETAKKPTDSIVCSLQAAGTSYKGTCNVTCSVNALAINFDGLETKRACSGPTRSVLVELAKTASTSNWIGTMQGVQPEDPARVEIVANAQGKGFVGRTPFGWFAVDQFEQQASTLMISMNADYQVRPTQSDIAIITRAIELLPNEAQWNKNDNRQCPAGQPKISLFCALQKATTEISGGIHYRQPALQAVREVLNTVDAKRIKTHRIMDYNNHPDTTLAEIHLILKNAETALRKDIR